MRSAGTEVEVAVLVHGGHLKYCHIHGVAALAVVAGQLRVADGGVEGETLRNGLALNATHVPAVPGHVGSRVVDLEDLRHPHQDAAPEVDPFQLRQAFCQLGVHGHRGVHSPAVIHPVAAFDQSGSLRSSHKLLCVQFLAIHYKPSSLKIHKRIVNNSVRTNYAAVLRLFCGMHTVLPHLYGNLINKAAVCAPLCAEQLNLVITLTKCRINSFGKKTASIA